MLYDGVLSVGTSGLYALSRKTQELDDDTIALYTWVVNGAGQINGVAFGGFACITGTGGPSKTSMTRGPSRGIVETAEVSCLAFET